MTRPPFHGSRLRLLFAFGQRSVVWSALRQGVAFWLLVGLLCPKTLWGALSAAGIVSRLVEQSYPQPALLALGALAFAAWLLYLPAARYNRWAGLFWWLMLAWGSAWLIYPLGVVQAGVFQMRATQVLSAYALGLLACRLMGNVKATLRLAVVCGVLQAAYALLLLAFGTHVWHSHGMPRAGGTFAQPVELDGAMTLCLPLAAALAYEAQSRITRAAWTLASLLIATALLLSLCRSGITATALTLIWLTHRLRPEAKRAAFVLAPVSVAIAAVLRSLSGWQRTVTDTAYRANIWRLTWAQFRAHPWGGVGMEQMSVPISEIRNGQHITLIFGVPENVFLLCLTERGIWGGILLALLILSAGQIILRSQHWESKAIGASLAGILIAGLLDTSFDMPERVPANGLIALLCGSLLMLAEQQTCEVT